MTQQPVAADYLGQDIEASLIWIVAPFVRERFFVDVGAEKGSFASLLFSLGMRGALFEPMARHHGALRELVEANGSRLFPFAIDANDSNRQFFVASGPDGRELDYFHSLHRLDAQASFRHDRSIPVTCRSIASLVEDGSLPRAVGILKTDTEGNDLSVLRGMGPLLPEMVMCEYFTEGLYSGWEEARPGLAIELMGARGYSRYVATKRVGEFEYCTSSPAGFIPRQWGNLFFLSDRLFESAESAIGDWLAQVEARLIGSMQDIVADRVAKEAVIQGLLAK
jgi:FkbM family methyltransferase